MSYLQVRHWNVFAEICIKSGTPVERAFHLFLKRSYHISHLGLGKTKFARSRKLYELIRSGNVTMGGNSKDKIYGTLQCRSGKRMKVQNRVFFANENEALAAGYRPCGHCMLVKYKKWKSRQAVA